MEEAEVVSSETLDGRLVNRVGILAIAFLSVDMPRVGVPFLEWEAEAKDEDCVVLWFESSVPDRGDMERTTELVATEATEREKEEDAYGPMVGDRYTSFSGTGGGRSLLKRLNLLLVGVMT
jgi:hypothetical protein